MYKIYRIESGETLEDIAKKFGTTIGELYRINGLMQGETLNGKQYIIVPVPRGVLFDLYIVKPGDTMYAIAQKYGVSENDLLKLNGIDQNDYIYPNQEILVPRKDVRFYITNEGDTLNNAASQLNVTPGEVLLQNETIYLLPDQLLVSRKDQNQE